MIENIIELLEKEYPDPQCSLDYDEAWQLLVSVRLAAQCTDERVNKVTPAFFAKYPTIYDLAEAKLEDVEGLVKSCGFYHHKAKDLIAMAQMVCSDFEGKIPDNMEDLLKLPGVGRKSANLIMGDVYHKPAVVCDTHCIRITNLLGLSTNKDPTKCEFELRKILPMDKASDFCHRMVLHGRAVCIARRPQCQNCCINKYCKHYNSL